MATYAELHELMNDSSLLDRVQVAVVIAAETINAETPPVVNRRSWGAYALRNPRGVAKEVLPAILAANKAVTVTNIQGASDSALQTNVDAIVDLFAEQIPVVV